MQLRKSIPLAGGSSILPADALKILLGVAICFPLLWMLATSLKPRAEVITWPPSLLPQVWMPSNYGTILTSGSFPRWLLNSVATASAVAFGNVLIGAPAAFAFARLRFKGKNLLFLIVISTLMIPGELTIIPLFVLLSRLGWIDTYYALTVPFLVSGFSIFLMRQFFEGIPSDIVDSARIDGCGWFRMLWSIFLPMSRSVVVVVVFFSFIGSWNSYLFPLIVTRSESMRTLTVGLSLFRQEYGTDWALLMGAATIIALPPLLAFVFLQRQLVDSFTLSGING